MVATEGSSVFAVGRFSFENRQVFLVISSFILMTSI